MQSFSWFSSRKMSNYIIYVTILLAAVAVIHAGEIKDYILEQPCGKTGGICILKGDCSEKIPKEDLGLCPTQQNQGVECCHGVSKREYRCNKFHGECFPESSSCAKGNLHIKQATDCPSGEVCCVLV